MKRNLLVISIIAIMSILLVACGGNDNANKGKGNDSGNSDETVELKVAVFPADLDSFEVAYEVFHEENPNIEVTFDSFPQKQYYEKIRIQLSGGVGYDVFAGQVDTLVDTGILQPLNDHIKDANMDVSGYGAIYDSMIYDDEVLGLPFRKSNWMLYYNKDIFDEQGVDYPSDDMTWDEFSELAMEVTREGDDPIYGAYMQQWPSTWYMQGIQEGASVLDKDLSVFENALQQRVDLEDAGAIMKWSEQVTTGAHYNEAFQKGNTAMNLIGDWHVEQLRTAKENGEIDFAWDVVPVPHPEGVEKNTTLALPVALMVNENSKEKEASLKFLEFMAGVEGAEIFAERGIIPGYQNDDIETAYLGEESQEPEGLHYFLETNEYAEYPMEIGVKNIVIEQIFKQEGELALLGEQTVEEAIKKMEERVESEWASKHSDN